MVTHANSQKHQQLSNTYVTRQKQEKQEISTNNFYLYLTLILNLCFHLAIMLDLFTIFTKGGIVLWCFKGTQQLFAPSVNALIRSVILQVRIFFLLSCFSVDSKTNEIFLLSRKEQVLTNLITMVWHYNISSIMSLNWYLLLRSRKFCSYRI